MFLSPASLLFTSSIFLSIILVASSPSLMISWIGLELNTLTFIPLILITTGQQESKAAVTYFLTQTLASVLFLEGSLLLLSPLGPYIATPIILGALFIKMGAAPFHMWLPQVVEGMTWSTLFLLFTVQKVNPFLILSSLSFNHNLVVSIALISAVIGSIAGLAQSQTRLLLVFSSINHVGWMLVSMTLSFSLFLYYFLLYAILLMPLFMILKKFQVLHLNQTVNLGLSSSNQLIVFLTLLSLGGLPPFLGFLPKWMVLQGLMEAHLFFASAVLVFMSLLTLFYYLRLGISAFTLSKSLSYPTVTYTYMSSSAIFLIGISLLGFPLSMLL
uniref:NADH dehydrogenase subunit 2 n=1 Tax=Podonevadne trigona TaxID=141406 RepID=UPI002E7A2563|nr:NADH dehydrogenase subunit 2 [Podonevadne trigona]WPT28355.1 NADH dehydrogenase subunit 2 [Podonevadne trigona]